MHYSKKILSVLMWSKQDDPLLSVYQASLMRCRIILAIIFRTQGARRYHKAGALLWNLSDHPLLPLFGKCIGFTGCYHLAFQSNKRTLSPEGEDYSTESPSLRSKRRSLYHWNFPLSWRNRYRATSGYSKNQSIG